VKLKAAVAAVLLVHMLVHPAGHALFTPAPTSPQLLSAPGEKSNQGWLEGARPCLACRSGTSMVASSVPVAAIAFPALWQPLPPATDHYSSLALKLSLSVRAPPLV